MATTEAEEAALAAVEAEMDQATNDLKAARALRAAAAAKPAAPAAPVAGGPAPPFNKSKPYGTLLGDGKAKFEQGGHRYDGAGNPVT